MSLDDDFWTVQRVKGLKRYWALGLSEEEISLLLGSSQTEVSKKALEIGLLARESRDTPVSSAKATRGHRSRISEKILPQVSGPRRCARDGAFMLPGPGDLLSAKVPSVTEMVGEFEE